MNRRVWREADEDQDGTPDEDLVYVWDGWRNIEERDYSTEDLLRDYVYGGAYIDEVVHGRSDFWDGSTLGPDGDFADSKEQFYYTTNNLYSVAALVDTSGNVIERYEYLPYGAVTTYTGAGVDSTWFTSDDVTSSYSDIQHVTFTGRRSDPESELMYFRNRYYSPELGRFVGRDEDYYDGANLYRAYFVPQGTDPSGRLSRCFFPGTAFLEYALDVMSSCCRLRFETPSLKVSDSPDGLIGYGSKFQISVSLAGSKTSKDCGVAAWFGQLPSGNSQFGPAWLAGILGGQYDVHGVTPTAGKKSNPASFKRLPAKSLTRSRMGSNVDISELESASITNIQMETTMHALWAEHIFEDERLRNKRGRYRRTDFTKAGKYKLHLPVTLILFDTSKKTKRTLLDGASGEVILEFPYDNTVKGHKGWRNLRSGFRYGTRAKLDKINFPN